MPANRFGFPVQAPQGFVPSSALTISTDTQLTPEGAPIFIASVSAVGTATVKMPDPLQCEGQIRTIVNDSDAANKVIAVEQFDGAAITLPVNFAAESSNITIKDSVFTTANTLNYSSVTYYCDGSTWFAISGFANGKTA
jgi:hypothetical protein